MDKFFNHLLKKPLMYDPVVCKPWDYYWQKYVEQDNI